MRGRKFRAKNSELVNDLSSDPQSHSNVKICLPSKLLRREWSGPYVVLELHDKPGQAILIAQEEILFQYIMTQYFKANSNPNRNING